MGTEIAQRPEGGGAIVPANQGANILMMVIDAARDPAIDASKVKTMADLAMQVQDREQQAEFNRALNAAIMEMPTITKAGEIKIPANREKGTAERIQGRFARFEDIDRVCRPILARHNLAIRFEIDSDGPLVAVRPIISHANGFVERGGAMKVPLEGSGSKNNVQAAGSSVSYCKRYSYCAALNIITEGIDDDGNGGKAVVLTYEREQVVLADAEAAHAAGGYQAFFDSQSPKDRAYLILSGKHAEYGGKGSVALPVGAKQPPAEPNPSPPPPPAQNGHRQTADEWLAAFMADVMKCSDRPTLARLEDRHARSLSKLRGEQPALGRQADEAIRDRRIDIDAGEKQGTQGGYGDDN